MYHFKIIERGRPKEHTRHCVAVATLCHGLCRMAELARDCLKACRTFQVAKKLCEIAELLTN